MAADVVTLDALNWESNPLPGQQQYSVRITRAQFDELHLAASRINKYKTKQERGDMQADHVWVYVDKNGRALPFANGGPLSIRVRRLLNQQGQEIYRLDGWAAPPVQPPPMAEQQLLPLPDATNPEELRLRLQAITLAMPQQQPLPTNLQQLQMQMGRMQFFLGEANAVMLEIYKLMQLSQ